MQDAFSQLVARRHSVRAYAPQPVSQEVLLTVLEAARMAPSAVNLQPWSFVVVRDAELLARLATTYKRDWFATAPACIVACGHHDVAWHRSSDGKDHCDIDVAIAVEHICLAAAQAGLGTCWVCNFDVAACRELLQLPPQVEPVALIPIGYPAHAQEVPQKKRKSIDEIVVWR